MLDIKLIREEPELVIKNLEYRGDKEKIKWVNDLLKIDSEYRKLLSDIDKMRHEKNSISVEISKMKKVGKNADFNIREMKKLSDKIKKSEKKAKKLQEKMHFYLMHLPNILHESVPKGEDDSSNIEIKKWGKKRVFAFKPKSHVDILENLDLLDMKRAGKVAGSRFFYIKKSLVLMELALMQFGIKYLMKKGFVPIETPFMIRKEAYEGVVDLGDFEDVIYKVENEDLYMIATAEHPLVSMHMNEVIPQKMLPIRYAGISPCFRKEAGSHGKDTKGIFRTHQFNKIEQLIFSNPDESWKELDRAVKNVEGIFQKLEIPYRLVNVCTGDIGSVAAKKIDLEAWMPAQNKYRELASCSNCTDYQARRLNIRYGVEGEKPKGLVHTVNATAIATGRTIVAIVENYQNEDGTITVPHILRQYMGGMKKIE